MTALAILAAALKAQGVSQQDVTESLLTTANVLDSVPGHRIAGLDSAGLRQIAAAMAGGEKRWRPTVVQGSAKQDRRES